MTKTSIALTELVEKGADQDFLRDLVSHVVERLMAMDVDNLCGAAYGERSGDRQNSRNGYRERLWETRAGSIPLKIPKLRSGSYFPPFLEPRGKPGGGPTGVVVRLQFPAPATPHLNA